MKKNYFQISMNKNDFNTPGVKGELVTFENEEYYKISHNDAMRPFFMTIVSDSNHWMFISSNGGLTAGRKNAEFSLFPYYTDDKITESAETTGSKSIFRIKKGSHTYLWEPFSDRYEGIYKTQRNLYKNIFGNKVIFEEVNTDLGVTFRYQWNSSNKYGFVKKSTFINNSKDHLEVTLIDGLQNILPADVTSDLQNNRSNLVDAYKKSELQTSVLLGIYALSAVIVDKAEPSEALKANIAWSLGLEKPICLISSTQLSNFRKGYEVHQEIDIKGEKGAYFIASNISLSPTEKKEWMFVANVNQSMVHIAEISNEILKNKNIRNLILEDIALGTHKLVALTGTADGLQLSDDKLRNARHFSNTLFNIMRGGVFDNNYEIERGDFTKYISKANKEAFKKRKKAFSELPESFSLKYIKEYAENDRDTDFIRLTYEYMPLKFSRRHGDPSRPWNKFSINTTTEEGEKILDYEGNWRDIFQNWETLAYSYPEFIDSMIFKFLDATTFDGYNPYRITKDGFDWEIIEPDDPWSFIGYWGDHQIVYLLKFLEFIEKHYPEKLASYFNRNIFVYANVPYKIKNYTDTLKNPKDTIIFDEILNQKILKRKEEIGADGALLADDSKVVFKVNLIEKLLATVLAKIANFIPEGGIWMNTQRPEWNDANNALVGNGISMVTLYSLRSFIHFFENIIIGTSVKEHEISEELEQFFKNVFNSLEKNKSILSGPISNIHRKTVLDGLGNAGSNYRTTIYRDGFSNEKKLISRTELLEFFSISKKYFDHTIKSNKTTDGLYHSYNLMTLENNKEISISHLSEMLEGQVAILSSGCISGADSLELLDALKNSKLFRENQNSYLLYPNKTLPRFSEKNNIPSTKVSKSDLLKQLVEDGNKQIIEKDINGGFHFNANFNNADSLIKALDELDEDYIPLIEKDKRYVLDTFESVFGHKSFTGRSGTFFGYEGLGSIYWHMVSKLVLSIQENCLLAVKNYEKSEIIERLFNHYYEANEGIGVHKSPKLYGAFPTDPYSHTPGGKGAQQPGMTGQVKEDILSRFGELGVFIKNGRIGFDSSLLRKEEFLKKETYFKYTNINKEIKEILIDKDSLCFTYCQTPVIYKLSEKQSINVVMNDKSEFHTDSLILSKDLSKKIFERTGEIKVIVVSINNKNINDA
jgi:hypothetical protein